MIRAARDALGTVAGWLFQAFCDWMWPKKKDDDPDHDGEPNS